jgi:2-(1,2-epoxy-1,2-dihydrophenyl)acetyl-CoA isomerase
VNADPDVRCVVLTGAGRAFSAGGDLKAMKDRRDMFAGSGADIRERYRRVVHRIVRSLYGLEVPLVAAVNGPAMGLGCDIAGLADIRIASETASFGVPFLKLGILPGDGGAWLMPATSAMRGRRDAVHRPDAGRADGDGMGTGQPGGRSPNA